MTEYESPIRLLYDSVMETFELCSEPMRTRLREAAASGLISYSVFFNPAFEPIETPKAHLAKKEIQLQTTHMSYLWTFCYTMIGLQELTYDYANSDKNVTVIEASSRTKELDYVIAWGMHLNNTWTIWPEGIPEPNSLSEQVAMTNELFLQAVRYLMYHEVAHLILHTNSYDLVTKIKSGNSATSEELRRFRNMELQADTFAYDSLFGSNDSEAVRYMNGLGALIAHLSGFLLLRNTNTRNGKHPDLDHRLKNIISRSKVVTEPFCTYLHLTITVGLQVFLSKHNPEYIMQLAAKGPHETFEELETDLFKLLDELKD